jgi:hypothetical protein
MKSKKTLLGRESHYQPIFEVVLDYEFGTWEQLEESCRQCRLHENSCRIFTCTR